MAGTLRMTGLEFVARGSRAFVREVEAVNKATERVEATFARISKMRMQPGDLKTVKDLVPKDATERLVKFTQGVGDLTGRLSLLSPQLGALTGSLGQVTGALGGMTGALGLTVGAAVAAGAALLALGMRGAAMPGIIQAFDIASQRAGVYSQVLLRDLRAAAHGTIPDLQLMRTANLALAGAGDELARALGQGGLAGLLEVARAQARATGQDVTFLFESLVSGVKRSSPLLIDNTGLVVNLGAAKQQLAAQLGVSVDAMTAEQQQIALLNATLDAGRVAVETYGQGTLQASERIAALQTAITNTLDKLAVAVQPVFNYILAIGQTLVSAIVWPIQNLVIPIIYELANALFGPLTEAFEGFKRGVGELFAPAAAMIHRWVVVVVGVLRGVGAAFRWVLQTIGKALQPVAGVLRKYLVEPVSAALDPTTFAKGAGYAFGALAQGILWAANTAIFPAVIAIAQFIADFLMGFSPPPKGPLRTIDKGGANTMLAWLEGFTGVGLQPVKAVAAEVDAALGAIGRMSSEQVAARLAKLDAALQPFEDRLAIVRAHMEALTAPLKELQSAVEKRLERALERFTRGQASAEEVRALDRQRALIEEQLSRAEEMTSEAEYQLALKKSQQAVERSLLAIQARRVKGTEQQARAAQEVAVTTERAARGGGAVEGLPVGGGGFVPDMSGDPVGDFLGVSDEEVDRMWGELGTVAADAFSDMAGDDLATAQQNLATLRGELGRIKDSKPFQTLQDAVKGVFGTGEGSLWEAIERFGNDVNVFFSTTLPGYFTGLPETLQQKLVTPFSKAVSDVFGALIGSGRTVTVTLKNSVEQVPLSLATWLSTLPGKLSETLVTPFSEKVRETWNYLTDTDNPDSLAARVSALPDGVVTWLDSLTDRLNASLVQPFYDRAADVWERLLGDGPDTLKTKLSDLPTKLGEWLADLPGKLTEYLLQPFENVIGDILNRLGDIGRQVEDLLGLSGAGGGGPAPGGGGTVGFGARGGRVKPGELWVVGERGWEFFRPDVPGQIIPHHQSVRLLNRLQPLPAVTPVRPVTTYQTNTSTVLTVNFSGPADNRQALRLRLSEVKALL